MMRLPRLFASWHVTWTGVVCAVLIVVGAVFDPHRELLAFRLIFFLWVEIGLAGLVIVAFERVTAAQWLGRFEESARILFRPLPAASLLLFAVLVGSELLNPVDGGTSDFRSWWFEPAFYLARSGAYLICWVLLARAPRTGFRLSKGAVRRVGTGWAVLFLGVFAFTFWLASVDWIMALAGGWQTTLFAIYNFAGLLLMAAALLGFAATSAPGVAGIDRNSAPAVFGDLSRFIFFTSCFWVYIWFCQYLLIWYAGIPSESSYYLRRAEGPWGGVFFLVPVLNWFIPCLVLLSRRVKMDQRSLWQVSILVLIGRWFDMYQLMLADRAAFSLPHFVFDLAPTLLVLSIWVSAGRMPGAAPRE